MHHLCPQDFRLTCISRTLSLLRSRVSAPVISMYNLLILKFDIKNGSQLNKIQTDLTLACVAWRFWLLSNKGGRGQKNRKDAPPIFKEKSPGDEVGDSGGSARISTAMLRRVT